MKRSTRLRLLPLAMLLAPLTACGGKEHILLSKPQPPAADLTVKPKPIMPEEAITDDAANARFNSAIEAWGDDGWATVARLCRWAAANGMAHPTCPVAP